MSTLAPSPARPDRRNALYWVIPLLVCLVVFHRGLFCWFFQDDFSWLRLEMHSFADFRRLLFEPMAQGTIRPWSERFFFLVFRRLFDLHALPYHAFVFLTQFANLLLLSAAARRLTGSRALAALAALVWTLNIGLVSPMAWTSAYNQILCSFFYLAAFLLFLRHLETGRWSFYFWQCAVFLLGFGALETIVVYPVVLLVYCLLLARPHAWKPLPLLVPSALYAAAHLWLIPRASSGPYVLHFDRSILEGLANYWLWSLGPDRLSQFWLLPRRVGASLSLLLTAALFVALARAPHPRRRAALFGLAWFLITIAPLLPLRDHRLDYYLTVPAIGLALAVAPLIPTVPRAAAALWLLVYFSCSVAYIEEGMRPSYHRSRAARRFIEAIRLARAHHPGKAILLTGVDESLFYAVIYDEGPLTAGAREVYLAPSNDKIRTAAGRLPVERYQLPARATLAVLRRGGAVVYDASGPTLQNVTYRYSLLAPDLLKPTPPRRVDVGDLLMADQLGPGWYEHQEDHRWMGGRAQVRLAAPQSARDRLRIQAIYPDQVDIGAFQLTVSANGIVLGRVEIRGSRTTEHVLNLPPSLIGQGEMTVTLETDRTFRIGHDPRDLALAFGVIELI